MALFYIDPFVFVTDRPCIALAWKAKGLMRWWGWRQARLWRRRAFALLFHVCVSCFYGTLDWIAITRRNIITKCHIRICMLQRFVITASPVICLPLFWILSMPSRKSSLANLSSWAFRLHQTERTNIIHRSNMYSKDLFAIYHLELATKHFVNHLDGNFWRKKRRIQ